MVYRDYLPYKSAREYEDRKMAKWMGFFLSEHSTSLNKEEETQAAQFERLPWEKLIARLNQSFLHQLTVTLWLDQQGAVIEQTGKVKNIDHEGIGFKSEDQFSFIPIKHILMVREEQEL